MKGTKLTRTQLQAISAVLGTIFVYGVVLPALISAKSDILVLTGFVLAALFTFGIGSFVWKWLTKVDR